MREIVLDTETTGLVPTEGHRLIEIGAVELFNHLPTGRVFHSYVNPGRDVPGGSAAGARSERGVPRRPAAVCRGGRGVPGLPRP